MLIDPLVLKKKLNRMATEQGAFAVLSSLLLYVTELAASDPQLRSKRIKWAEGKANKVSYNQPCPDPNRGQYPTRFQLLRSRFLNNNREPYTKKRREVGKLVIKEKLWVSRAGNKPDRSRDRKGDGKAVEEDADTVASERARWSSMSGRNTVKDILKKFLAAEEKEAKEKSLTWKKKGPNNSLPKMVNKNSVLSKLKEQFEQSALRSAAEVKASLVRKGEKKPKNFTSRKTIRKPEVRVLRTAAMTTTDINSPESQYLVCSTVPVLRLSIATEINHPWSWSKNNAAMHPLSHEAAKRGGNREPGENKTPAKASQDREDKEESLVVPKTMSGAKDHAEDTIDSTKHGPNFNPDLDSSSATHKNKAPEDYIHPLSKSSLECNRNNTPAGPDIFSLLGSTNAAQRIKEESPPSNSPYSSTTEGSHEQSPQDTKTSEIPEITMYVYNSEEDDTQLIEPEKDPFFAGQKCFPEQALENILPFYSPGVQATCEIELPMENQQTTLLTPAAGKRPPIVKKEAPGLRGRCSEEVKGAKHRFEDKISSTSIKNDNDVQTEKEEGKKMPNSQVQNGSKTKQFPHKHSPKNNFDNSSPGIPNPDVNQMKPALSSNEGQEQKPDPAEEEDVSSYLEKTQNPLTGDLVKHSSYIGEEDFGKDKLYSSNEMKNHGNNRALGRSTLTDLETCHNQSKYFIEHEETTADEMPWPDSEASQLYSSNPLTTPMSGITGQGTHHALGNPPAPPPTLGRQGADEHACCGCEKDPLPSSDELANSGNDTTVQNETARDFKNQVLPSNNPTENENSTAEETNTCQDFENRLLPLTKKPGKQENKTTLTRKPLLPLEKNQNPTLDETMKQGNNMLEENLFTSSTELASDQKKHEKGSNKVPRNKKDNLLSSDNDKKHENDMRETEEREMRNVLHKSQEEKLPTPSDMVDHDNNSPNKNAHRPQSPQLPPSEHDNNVQGVKNTGQSLKRPTPSSDFVKREHDLTLDEDIHYNNEKHHLPLSNEPMKHVNSSTEERNIKKEERNIKPNFKNYSIPKRNASRQDNKTSNEKNTPLNLKKEPVQHKKSCEEERNTSCDPKNQIPSPNPLVKQDKKSSPLQIPRQMSPGNIVKPETKSVENQTKHNSEKPQLCPSNKVLKPRERSSSGEKKQKTPAVGDTRSSSTKTVKDNNELQGSGNNQLHPSRKSTEREENTPEGEKQQTRCEDFMTPDKNAAKGKKKFPSSRKYQSASSETLVKPQEKNTPEQKQQATASAGFKKSGTNHVKEKEGDPNPDKSSSSKKVVTSQEKNTSGNKNQRTPAAQDIRSPESRAVKEGNKHHHSVNNQLPPSSKSAKPEKNTSVEENQQKVSESLTKPGARAVKGKSQDLDSGMCQSPPSNSLMKPQEKNVTAKKKQLPPAADEKTMCKTGSPEKKRGPERREKYQLRSLALTEKHGSESAGKQGPVDNLKGYQTPSTNDEIACKSNTVPKETSLPNTDKSPKSSLFYDASKYEKNPAEIREKQTGFTKYQALSSKTLVRHEKDVAESEGSRQAPGKTSDGKTELEDCSKAASFAKYTVESYSERLLDSSFKPLIIRVTDTFKHHS